MIWQKEIYQWRWRNECNPSLSVISAAFMAFGRSCLLANTRRTASRNSSYKQGIPVNNDQLEARCITLFLHPMRQRNSVQIPDYTIADIIKSRHWSHTCRYSPHPTYDEAHLLPPQHDLYHCYPLQRWDPECSGSSVATMAGSVTSQEII
jgi:hypothetical protein